MDNYYLNRRDLSLSSCSLFKAMWRDRQENCWGRRHWRDSRLALNVLKKFTILIKKSTAWVKPKVSRCTDFYSGTV